MRGIRSVASVTLCVGAVLPVSVADVIYDSKGFEEFEGFIADEGQDGWYPNEGTWPFIWTGPPSKGAKSVQLRVYMADGSSSGMSRDTADLLAQGYQRVTVFFEVYRPSPKEQWFPDLTWSAGVGGNPVHGGQWNMNDPLTSRTYPFIDSYDPWVHDPSVDTVVDDWASVELTWDFEAGLAFGFYDGVLVSEKEIEDIYAFSGFGLIGEHGGAPNLHYTESIWVDNFIITAEKGGCYPECDGDDGLDLFDFLCFVNAFDAGDPYADCEANGVTDLFDFLCFVNAFNEGC
jgi:hypothetical protein